MQKAALAVDMTFNTDSMTAVSTCSHDKTLNCVSTLAGFPFGLLGGVMVRASDLRSSGRGFDSRPGRCRATHVYSAFHPSGVGKSSTGLSGWAYGGARSLVSGGS